MSRNTTPSSMVLNNYNEGGKQAKSSIMKPAFSEQATIFGVGVDSKLTGGAIQGLYDTIDTAFRPSPEAKAAIASRPATSWGPGRRRAVRCGLRGRSGSRRRGGVRPLARVGSDRGCALARDRPIAGLVRRGLCGKQRRRQGADVNLGDRDRYSLVIPAFGITFSSRAVSVRILAAS